MAYKYTPPTVEQIKRWQKNTPGLRADHITDREAGELIGMDGANFRRRKSPTKPVKLTYEQWFTLCAISNLSTSHSPNDLHSSILASVQEKIIKGIPTQEHVQFTVTAHQILSTHAIKRIHGWMNQ